jgi:excisionase family DNA binding protein
MSISNSPYLSTVQAAEALGVSVSTVKRWVDEGVLPAQKTPGGHRKLVRAEILALARQGNLPRGDLGALTGVAADAPGAVAAALRDAILGGLGAEANAIIRRAYSSGLAVDVLADEVVKPAMVEVGRRWETQQIDVWQEHRATLLCSAALYELKDELEVRTERQRPLALVGAPEHDPYLLPPILAQLVLLDAGWEVVQLGPNTPLTSMARAVEALKPKMLCVSATSLLQKEEFIRGFRELCRLAEKRGVAVAVGGQALAEDVRSAIPYTTYGDRMSHLAAFARTLHPRPKTPRRGRPARS